MHPLVRQNPVTSASLAILIAGWVAVGLFAASGMNQLYPAAWWVRTGVFCSVLFGPLAGILAVGGFFFDARRGLALIAFVLSVLTTLEVLILGI